jgi:hypothetical protein
LHRETQEELIAAESAYNEAERRVMKGILQA